MKKNNLTIIKKVVLRDVVDWKTKTISIPKDTIYKFLADGVKRVIFVDEEKGEKWTFAAPRIFATMKMKEERGKLYCFFSIELAKKETFEPIHPGPQYVYDKPRNTMIEVSRESRYLVARQDVVQIGLFK